MSLTKEAILTRLADKAGITKVDAAKVLSELREITKDQLVSGNEKLVLPGIVTLTPTARAARVGRNPQTGAAIEIAAKRGVKALLDKGLRDLMV